MSFDDILRVFWARPVYQRLFLAFTVGLFLSCGARVSSAHPTKGDATATAGTEHAAPTSRRTR